MPVTSELADIIGHGQDEKKLDAALQKALADIGTPDGADKAAAVRCLRLAHSLAQVGRLGLAHDQLVLAEANLRLTLGGPPPTLPEPKGKSKKS